VLPLIGCTENELLRIRNSARNFTKQSAAFAVSKGSARILWYPLSRTTAWAWP